MTVWFEALRRMLATATLDLNTICVYVDQLSYSGNRSSDNSQAKAKAGPKKASKTDAGSVVKPQNDSPQKHNKKRSAAEAVDVVNGAATDSPKRQKKAEAVATEADLQVRTSSAAGPRSRVSQHSTPAEVSPSLMYCAAVLSRTIKHTLQSRSVSLKLADTGQGYRAKVHGGEVSCPRGRHYQCCSCHGPSCGL